MRRLCKVSGMVVESGGDNNIYIPVSCFPETKSLMELTFRVLNCSSNM